MKLTRDNNFLTIDFTGYSPEFILGFETGLGQYTGVREKGYENSREYKMGRWDGYTLLYEKDKHRIAEGLYPQVVTYIKELQKKIPSLKYTVEDLRDEPFMGIEDLPDELTFIKDGKTLTLRDYQYKSVASAIDSQKGILSGAVNMGKTSVSIALIQQLAQYLEKGETIAYFVPSLSIFSQVIPDFEENFGKENVGHFGGGKKKLSKINVISMSSMNSALKDPTADPKVKLSGKARTLQIFEQEVRPFFTKSTHMNFRTILKNLSENYPDGTKSRKEIKGWLKSAYETEYSDLKVKQFINKKHVEYRQQAQGKVGNKYDTYLKTLEFVDSVRVIIVDEGHHSGADGAFKTLTSFPNAQYKFAMTGSHDPGKELQTQRMYGLYGGVIAKVSNKELISRGVSAKPTINLVRITGEINFEHFGDEKDYLKVVDKGIVHNDDRNTVIVRLVERMYQKGNPTLIIVGRVEHGEILLDMIQKLGIPEVVFLSGASDEDTRKKALEDFELGKLKIIIGTTIFDEGLSVNSFKALFMVSSTRSPRLVIQRIGRVLREKKGENTAVVFDIFDSNNVFLKSQGEARLKIYKQEEFETRFLN